MLSLDMNFIGFKLHIVGVDLFGGYAYSYILETDNNIFIIDANIETGKKLFVDCLKQINIGIKPIKVLLTHGHWDHVGLAYYLQKRYKAKIYANKESETMMSDKQYQVDNLYDEYAPEYSFSAGILKVWKKDFIKTTTPDFYLNNGDEFIDNDFCLKVYKTPGHCNDELSFYNPQNKIIFSGDTIQAKGYYNHPALYNDRDSLLKSIDIIEELGPIHIYGGHFYIDDKYATKKFVQESRIFVQTVNKYVDNNKNLSFDELLNKFIKDFGYEYSMHVVQTLKAHTKN